MANILTADDDDYSGSILEELEYKSNIAFKLFSMVEQVYMITNYIAYVTLESDIIFYYQHEYNYYCDNINIYVDTIVGVDWKDYENC